MEEPASLTIAITARELAHLFETFDGTVGNAARAGLVGEWRSGWGWHIDVRVSAVILRTVALLLALEKSPRLSSLGRVSTYLCHMKTSKVQQSLGHSLRSRLHSRKLAPLPEGLSQYTHKLKRHDMLTSCSIPQHNVNWKLLLTTNGAVTISAIPRADTGVIASACSGNASQFRDGMRRGARLRVLHDGTADPGVHVGIAIDTVA